MATHKKLMPYEDCCMRFVTKWGGTMPIRCHMFMRSLPFHWIACVQRFVICTSRRIRSINGLSYRMTWKKERNVRVDTCMSEHFLRKHTVFYGRMGGIPWHVRKDGINWTYLQHDSLGVSSDWEERLALTLRTWTRSYERREVELFNGWMRANAYFLECAPLSDAERGFFYGFDYVLKEDV